MKNTFVKVLSLLMALMMVAGVFSVITVSAATCDHANGGKYVKTIPATCQTAGYDLWHCDDCGADYMLNYQPKSDAKHQFKTEYAKDPTCTAEGYNTHKVCEVEGCTYVDPNKEVYPKLPHQEVTEKVAADCLNPERWVTTCTVCKNVVKDVPVEGGEAAKGHKNDYIVEVEPTICTDGKVIVKCGVCKITLAETITLKAKHQFEAVLNPTFACCEYKIKDNVQGDHTPMVCKLCGTPDEYTEKKAAVEHDYSYNWVTATGGEGALEGTILTIADMNKEIEKLGYKVGDSIINVATCQKTGKRLGICACGKYGEAILPMSDHSDDDLTTEYWLVEPGKDTEAWTPAEFMADMNEILADKSCVAEIILITYCPDCDYEKSSSVIAAAKADHNWDKKVKVEMNCGENIPGYSVIYCKDCEHATETTTDIVYVEHKYSAWAPAEDATCEDAIEVEGKFYLPQTRTCSVCGDVDESDGATNAKPVTSLTHKYTNKTKTVDPTCTEFGYTYKVCDDCGFDEEVVANSQTNKNPNVHSDACKAASRAAAEEAGTLQATAATCTTDGYEKFRATCATGNVYIEVNIPALGHTYHEGTEEDPFVDVTIGGKTTYGAYVEPTCHTFGYEGRAVCTVCGVAATDRVKIGYDSTNHTVEGTLDGTPVAANCQTRGYKYMYYSCCNKLVKEYTTDELGGHSWELSPYVGATCTQDGYHSHMWCGLCYTPKTDDLQINECECGLGEAHIDLQLRGQYVIPKTGHDFNKTADALGFKVAKHEETCDKFGWESYIKCANPFCTVYNQAGDHYALVGTQVVIYCATDPETKGIVNPKTTQDTSDDKYQKFYDACYIAPHLDTKVVTVGANEVTAPSCTDAGVVSGTYCGKCKVYTVAQTITYWDIIENKFTTKQVNKGDAVITVGKLGHNLQSEPVNAPAPTGWDCTEPTFTVKMCSRCTYSEAGAFEVGKDNHTWGEYDVLDFAVAADRELAEKLGISINPCINGVYKVRKCTCTVGGNVCAAYDVPVLVTPAGKHEVNIGGTTFTIDLSCGAIDTWDGQTCKNCGITIDADVHVEHREMILTNMNDEDYDPCTVDGYYIKKCADCDKNLHKAGDPQEFTAKLGHKTNFADKDAAEASARVDYVKSYTPATETTNGSLVYVCKDCGIEVQNVCPATAPFVITGTASAEKIAAATDISYTVSFAGVAKKFTTLKIEVAYDSSKFDFVGASSNLTGNVYASASEETVGVTLVSTTDMNTTVAGDDVVTLIFTAKKYAMGTATFDVTNIEGLKNVTADVDAATVAINGLGNADGKGYVTAEDALAILTTENYDAQFDINGDGMVDLLDVALVGTFAASTQTAKDYLVMLGTYGEIQATIDALYADGMLADCNKDGRVTINDYYALIAGVEKELNEYESYADIDFESVEAFVMKVMNDMIKTVYA